MEEQILENQIVIMEALLQIPEIKQMIVSISLKEAIDSSKLITKQI